MILNPFFQLNFDIFLGFFFAFCPFLLYKDFHIFHISLSRAFLCGFDNSYLSFLYIEKVYKKYFIYFKNELYYVNRLKSELYSALLYLIFFIKILSIRIFFIRTFSVRIRRNIYVVSKVLRNLFLFNNIFMFEKHFRIAIFTCSKNLCHSKLLIKNLEYSFGILSLWMFVLIFKL